MSDDSFLRGKAREVIQSGKLPDAIPDQVWGGRGTGVECAICAQAIRHGEMELEIEFSRHCLAQSYFVHLRCFSILETERQKLSAGANSPLDHVDAMAARDQDASPA